MNEPFECWLIAQCFEAEQADAKKRERWTGLYLLATDAQRNFIGSMLENLILPDETEKSYRLKMLTASVEGAIQIVNELQAEADRQAELACPHKQFLRFQKILS